LAYLIVDSACRNSDNYHASGGFTTNKSRKLKELWSFGIFFAVILENILHIHQISMKPSEISAFPMQLAVATKDGLSINEHFGHVKQFWIYQLSPEHCRFLETREVAHYCLGQHSDASAMSGILEAVKDCHAVFVAKIGEGPTNKLKAIGVGAVPDYAYAAVKHHCWTMLTNWLTAGRTYDPGLRRQLA
jgi:predicted Fe-Mo cluster-binding NifX family protein